MSPSPRQSRPADQPEPDIARVAAIAVSMGDPAGIGPDIALMSWLQRQHHALPPFVLYADPDVLAQRARALGLAVPLAAVASPAEAAAAFAERACPSGPCASARRDEAPTRRSWPPSKRRPRPWQRARRWRW